MASDARSRTTSILIELSQAPTEESVGASAEELFQLLYGELRRLARGVMRFERPDHTLEPTGLVHEAYFKLVDQTRVDWRGRSHFMAVAARVMRRLLIDHARARGREKRGGGWQKVSLVDWRAPTPAGALDAEQLLGLDAALAGLAEIDRRAARVVELRFFAGLRMAEIAEALRVSKRTVEGDWVHARAWLKMRLANGNGR